MKCPNCNYEPTLSEIQRSPDACVKCSVNYEVHARKVVEDQLREEGRQEALAEHRLAAALGGAGRTSVVVTDVQMPFSSMVRFMVMWALASIPALIILCILFVGLASIIRVLGMF